MTVENIGNTRNTFFSSVVMANSSLPVLEQVLKAFTYHQPITITKKDGKNLERGYIMIMYGNVGFRIQCAGDPASHFVSLAEIDSVSVGQPEPTLF
jgi:hypothetical protein